MSFHAFKVVIRLDGSDTFRLALRVHLPHVKRPNINHMFGNIICLSEEVIKLVHLRETWNFIVCYTLLEMLTNCQQGATSITRIKPISATICNYLHVHEFPDMAQKVQMKHQAFASSKGNLLFEV